MKLASNLAGFSGIDSGKFSEGDSAVFVADLVLVDPHAAAPFAEAQSEAAQIVIEDNRLAFALREGELGDVFE
jgi:phosphoglycerate dehydrogenase-like enzyme